MTEKITLVTVSFNQGAYLEQALRSVLTQGYANLEYVLVDAGSSDNTVEIIGRYREQLSHCIVGPDDGPADGLNKGFAEATGTIYGYLNADDALLPGALKFISEVFRDNPGVDVVTADGVLWDNEGRILRKIIGTSFNPVAYVFGACPIVQQATFFRAKAYERAGGFNKNNRSCWDGELLVQMARAGARFLYVSMTIGAFRKHRGSLSFSTQYRDLERADQERVTRMVLGRTPSKTERTVRNAAYRMGRFALEPGRFWEALRWRFVNAGWISSRRGT